METGGASLQSCSSGGRRCPRIEVFSVLLEDQDLIDMHCMTSIFGVVLVRSCNHNYPIFDCSVRGPPQVCPQGLLTLTDPECSIPVEDEVHLLSWLMAPYVLSMTRSEDIMWNAHVDDMDLLLRRTFKGLSSKLHVSFSVYHDPVEAHFDAYFVDLKCPEEQEAALIRVCGTVSASNSSLPDPDAKSFLFRTLGRQSVSLKAGKSVPLTLSRKMTVVPRHSNLSVDVKLEVHIGHGDILTFEDKVKFSPSLDSGEERIILPCGCPTHGKLSLKVTWVECENCLEQ